MEPFFLRNPATSVAADGRRVIVVGPDGSVAHLESHVAETCEVLAFLRRAHSRADIQDATGMPKNVLETVLATLVKQQVVLTGPRAVLQRALPASKLSKERPCKRLVLGISGTIQAANLLGLARDLNDTFAEAVEVILTEAAVKFLRPEAVSYVGLRVWTDPFEAAGEINVPHIWLAHHADMVLVAPASAHTLHRMASGACSDLLSLVTVATHAPVVVAPTMNYAMFNHPSVKRNIDCLRRDGVYVLEPSLGFEISRSSDRSAEFCGIGVRPDTLVPLLKAVLREERRSARAE
jgi:phosphopantothenoylcysteine decarboxylase/phosphopantothenate--cysteine ligase